MVLNNSLKLIFVLLLFVTVFLEYFAFNSFRVCLFITKNKIIFKFYDILIAVL